MQLQTSLIRLDGGTQTRHSHNQEKIKEYADIILESRHNGEVSPFPPITVVTDGNAYWLADGFHRYLAHREANEPTIAVEAISGTQRDAVLIACGANAKHGLPRTAQDKRKAVTILLEDTEWQKWSDREIARRCGVGKTLVGDLRKSHTGLSDSMTPTDRTFIHHKTGKESVMPTANIGSRPKEAPPKAHRPLWEAPTDTFSEECEPIYTPSANTPRFAHQEEVEEVLPKPRLERVWDKSDLDGIAEIAQLATKMLRDMKRLRDLVDKNNITSQLSRRYQGATYRDQSFSAYHLLRALKSFHDCAYCKGEKCERCINTGYMESYAWDNTPEKVRNSVGRFTDFLTEEQQQAIMKTIRVI